MAKFGYILCDKKVFVGDMIGFDFSKSTFSPDEAPSVVSHEFSADNTNWINVTQQKYISWQFSTTGQKTVYLRLTSGSGSEVFNLNIDVLDLTSQKLFSNDFDLVSSEHDIMKWLPKRWSSWNLVHLKAQEYILNTLAERSIYDKDGKRYTKDDIQDLAEVKEWSIALALRFIFSGISNADNDVFKAKSDEYDEKEQKRASAARIKLDHNKNQIIDDEKQDLRSVMLVRR